MSPELEQAIAQLIILVSDGSTYAATLAQQQLPLILTDYLRWAIVEGLVVTISWVVAMWVSVRRVVAIIQSDIEPNAVPPTILLWGALLTTAAMASIHVFPRALDALQAVVAPRAYLLDQLMGFVS